MKRTRYNFKLFRVVVLTLLVSACSLLPQGESVHQGPQPNKTYKLTVLHTNDHHGRFWRNYKGEWGMAARMTLVNQIRDEVQIGGGYTLLLSGGDINTGVPESDLQNAIPDFKGMNMLGYDAMAVGNHEFDNPREVLTMQEKLADFPFLSANIIDEKTGKPAFTPYTNFEFDGLRIAVMGLTTTDTPKTTNPENVEGLDFISPVEVSRKLVPQLRENNDIVIATTHMGHYPNANFGVNAPGDVTLARKVKGFDLIVGGHSQYPLFEPDLQNGAYIVQAYEWGKYVGRADFEYHNGNLKLVKYELIPVNHKKSDFRVAEDNAMLQLLQTYQDRGAKLVEQKVGSVDQRLMGERSEVRFQPTNLGNLLARSFMAKTGADFATVNAGGIRASIEEGEITYKDVLTVFPFGNTLTTVVMNGQEVMDYLNVVATKPAKSAAFAHFAGIEMVIAKDKVHNVKFDGQPIVLTKNYKMALLSFSAGGGDNYPNLKTMAGYVDTGFTDAEVLRQFIQNQSPIKVDDFKPEGVIRLKSDGTWCSAPLFRCKH